MRLKTYSKKEQRTFEELPFNIIDALILAQVSYFDFSPIKDKLPLKFADLKYNKYYKTEKPYFDSFVPKTSLKHMQNLIVSERYKNIEILEYEATLSKKDNTQYCAIAYLVNDIIVVSFEGTDPSYTGWREDFLLSFKEDIPSYKLALDFLNMILEKYPNEIILAGHSKGGNIATYLLATIPDDSRIKFVYSFEGPGFRNKEIFNKHQNRLTKFLKVTPQSSLVGVLFTNSTDLKIIKSNNILMFQHNPFEWQIKNNDFIYLTKRSITGNYLDKSFNGWIYSLTEEERERFTNILFDSLDNFETQDFLNFFKAIFKQIKPFMKAYKSLSEDDQKFFKYATKKLVKNFLSAKERSKNLQNKDILVK